MLLSANEKFIRSVICRRFIDNCVPQFRIAFKFVNQATLEINYAEEMSIFIQQQQQKTNTSACSGFDWAYWHLPINRIVNLNIFTILLHNLRWFFHEISIVLFQNADLVRRINWKKSTFLFGWIGAFFPLHNCFRMSNHSRGMSHVSDRHSKCAFVACVVSSHLQLCIIMHTQLLIADKCFWVVRSAQR